MGMTRISGPATLTQQWMIESRQMCEETQMC